MQTKKGSLKAAIVNTSIGFIVTLIFSPLIYSMCGIKTNPWQLGLATFYFTIISIARSYVIRRFFNGLKPRKNKAKKVSKEESDSKCPVHSYVRISSGLACQFCGETAGNF